jgi:hypothetical protein
MQVLHKKKIVLSGVHHPQSSLILRLANKLTCNKRLTIFFHIFLSPKAMPSVFVKFIDHPLIKPKGTHIKSWQ